MFCHLHIGIYRNIKLQRPISQNHTSEKPLTVLYTNGHISKSQRGMNLIVVSIKAKSVLLTMIPKTQYYPKCQVVSYFVGVHHKYESAFIN